MPWTAPQHRLFEAAAHDPKVAKDNGIAQSKAKEMASEGVKQGKGKAKPSHDPKMLGAALMKRET